MHIPKGVKHKQHYIWYHQQPEPKATYNIYLNRLLKRGMTREQAINHKNYRGGNYKKKTFTDQKGRVCTNRQINITSILQNI